MGEWLGIALGVECDLIPFVGELLAQREPGLVAELLTQIGAHPEVAVVVTALEVLMVLDRVEHVWAHIRLEHLCCDRPMVGNADRLADVMAQ